MATDGKARGARRCSKRIGSKKCGNWSEENSDRCALHPRTTKAPQVNQSQPITSEAVPPDSVDPVSNIAEVDGSVSVEAVNADECGADLIKPDLGENECGETTEAVVDRAATDVEEAQRRRTERVRRAFAKLFRGANGTAAASKPAQEAEPLNAAFLNPRELCG